VVRYPRAAEPAVNHVSFDAPAGAITAIAGPNGSGKSTLVRALLGRVPVASGSIFVEDADATHLDRREIARRVAVVSQREEPVFPLSVRDYIALGRHPHLPLWSTVDRAGPAAIARAIEEAEVQPFLDRTTDELSGGEWQRVRVARALAQDTPAIVFDEPTTFLDIAHEMACFELLDALAGRGRTVLVVSHQLNLVARFASRVGLLSSGTVAAFGDPAEVMRGEVLERVYQWPLVVSRDPAVGSPMLVPLRRHR
ncbi:MAG: ABC transporter ATP-binding protein, partial [Cytophagaceae bacterium]|nr:ABC transporter ATP-binding protein [Gemmatimonadaceae bacterium]